MSVSTILKKKKYWTDIIEWTKGKSIEQIVSTCTDPKWTMQLASAANVNPYRIQLAKVLCALRVRDKIYTTEHMSNMIDRAYLFATKQMTPKQERKFKRTMVLSEKHSLVLALVNSHPGYSDYVIRDIEKKMPEEYKELREELNDICKAILADEIKENFNKLSSTN